MRFWSQIVAFYYLQFINVWISVIMVIFHNTECDNKCNKLKSCFYYYIKYFSLRLHMFSLWGCHVMNERVEKPKDSTAEPTGCWAITPWDDSFFPSHIKDSFKMNKLFKNHPSQVQTADSFRNLINGSHYEWAFNSLVHPISSKLNTSVLLTDAQQFGCGFIGNIFVGKTEQKHNIVLIIYLLNCCIKSHMHSLYSDKQHSCDIARDITYHVI